MNHPAIRIEGLWKDYRLGPKTSRSDTFYDLLASGLRAPLQRLRRLQGRTSDQERFWALQDINLEIQPGEVVGVIGRNGAGKSTLLKILSRITAPTRGRIKVRGRLASLLEVGTGFHPELSGRENIYLNGAILGMARREVARKFDEIVAFAEIEKFLDTPVKRYSSGMYVRLAFAVAAHLDADVLLVDEVLAVGDAAFQERCLARMGDLSGTGRTVVFVSHNLAAVSRLCSRALLLDRGSLLGDGSVAEGLAAYGLLNHKQSESIRAATIGPLQDKVQFLGLTVNGSADLVNTLIPPDQPIRIAIRGNLTVPLHGFRVTLCLFKGDQLVLGMHDAMAPEDMPQGDFESIFELPALFLSPGNYAIDVNMYSEERSEWLLAKGCCTFTVATAWHPLYEPTHGMGLVNLARSGRRHPLASEREAPRA